MVSTCLAGAFVGSLISGWIADEVGRRRAFQLSALPMLIGAPIWYLNFFFLHKIPTMISGLCVTAFMHICFLFWLGVVMWGCLWLCLCFTA